MRWTLRLDLANLCELHLLSAIRRRHRVTLPRVRRSPNLNPVGRAYYAFSTSVCTLTSLSQEVGAALGAQAGESRLREVATAGGFRHFRRAAQTPFNLVLEARL
jgi:hypothetical protein